MKYTELTEFEERAALKELLRYIIQISGAEYYGFAHLDTSGRELTFRTFDHFDPIGRAKLGKLVGSGDKFVLSMPLDSIITQLDNKPLVQLPLLTDLAAVALAANDYSITTSVELTYRGYKIEKVDNQLATNFHGLGGELLVSIKQFLMEIAIDTWVYSPTEFKDKFLETPTIRSHFLLGYTWHPAKWRWGKWLLKEELSRTYIDPNPNSALCDDVTELIKVHLKSSLKAQHD